MVELFVESAQICSEYLNSVSPVKWTLMDTLDVVITEFTEKIR